MVVFYYFCGYLVYSREILMLNADLTIIVEDINRSLRRIFVFFWIFMPFSHSLL